MKAIDVVIILVIVGAAVHGYMRGFVAIALDLLGYAVAIAIAIVAYPYLGAWLAGITRATPMFASAAAFGLVFALVQAVYSLILSFRFHHLQFTSKHVTINKAAGLAANAVKMLAVITITLIVFSGLPLASSQKTPVVDARIPQMILAATTGLQERYARTIGRPLAATINFLTVKQENHERVELGFTTTSVRVRPELEDQMLLLVNNERSKYSLPMLVVNAPAREVARKYSKEMFATGVFAHTDTRGKSPFDRMEEGGVEFGAAGENLALAPTLLQAHTGLMNSPGHRANILSPDYKTVGIGIVDGGPYGLMVTQEFTD